MPDTAASAFAAAVCRWHHAHNGQPVPCDMLTVADAAEDAGTTERTIRRWIADGKLTAHRINGRIHVAWADLNQVEAATRRHGGRRRMWDNENPMS